jgi:hypothetical protein
MTVKKKVVLSTANCDSIDLTQSLTRVREAISQLPTEEGVVMNENTSAAATESAAPVKKAVKKVTKKKTAPAASIKLADICRSLKIEPRIARRVLRAEKVKNPGRWTWLKGSSEATKVTTLLKASKNSK